MKIIPDNVTYKVTHVKVSVFEFEAPGYVDVLFSNGEKVRFNESRKDGSILRNRNISISDELWSTLLTHMEEQHAIESGRAWDRSMVDNGWTLDGMTPYYGNDS